MHTGAKPNIQYTWGGKMGEEILILEGLERKWKGVEARRKWRKL